MTDEDCNATPSSSSSDLLHALESVLTAGETSESFVEASVRVSVERRRSVQATFIARGLHTRDEARRSGDYVDADAVCDGLQRKLDAAERGLPDRRN